MYVLASTQENGSHVHRLHALDIGTGEERRSIGGMTVNSPVVIQGSVLNSEKRPIAFDPALQLQRPALLLHNGALYIGFGSHGDLCFKKSLFDFYPYYGWVFAYDARALEQVGIFNSMPNAKLNGFDSREGGGIWMSGSGASADDTDPDVYLATGNGHFDQRNQSFGSSILRLSLHRDQKAIAVKDFFSPWNRTCLDENDLDVGSSGVLLIPHWTPKDGRRANGKPLWLMLGAGKEGKLYLMNRDKMGGGSFSTRDRVIQTITIPTDGKVHHVHGAPVYWESPTQGKLIYVWPEFEYLKAYRLLDNGTFGKNPVKPTMQSPHPLGPGMPGGFLSISFNADDKTRDTGIVWASHPREGDAIHALVPGQLDAFAASDLSKRLWSSRLHPEDEVGIFAKFCPPTIANGKVYLATFSERLNVYGILPQPRPLVADAPKMDAPKSETMQAMTMPAPPKGMALAPAKDTPTQAEVRKQRNAMMKAFHRSDTTAFYSHHLDPSAKSAPHVVLPPHYPQRKAELLNLQEGLRVHVASTIENIEEKADGTVEVTVTDVFALRDRYGKKLSALNDTRGTPHPFHVRLKETWRRQNGRWRLAKSEKHEQQPMPPLSPQSHGDVKNCSDPDYWLRYRLGLTMHPIAYTVQRFHFDHLIPMRPAGFPARRYTAYPTPIFGLGGGWELATLLTNAQPLGCASSGIASGRLFYGVGAQKQLLPDDPPYTPGLAVGGYTYRGPNGHRGSAAYLVATQRVFDISEPTMNAVFFHAGVKVETFDSRLSQASGVRPFIGNNVSLNPQMYFSGELSWKQRWERSHPYSVRGTYLFYKNKYGIRVGIQNNGYERRFFISPVF